MPKNLCYFLLCMLLTANCRNSTGSKEKEFSGKKYRDSAVTFCEINKDRANISIYWFEKEDISPGLINFKYTGKEDTFSILCDTFNKKYQGQFRKGDTVELEIEKSNFYAVNGTEFLVLKLVGDKNVTDGSFSVFVSPEFGVLLNKSNTWRRAWVLCPDKRAPRFSQLIALLYRVQTDNEFFLTPVPDIRDMEKFTPPKVE